MRHATIPDVVVKLMEGRARVAKGWCQGQETAFRPHCFGGTMYCAMGAIGSDYVAAVQLTLAVPGGGNVMAYNDAKGRTQADILALFDRAIEGALRVGEWKPVSDAPGAIKEWVDAQ